MYSKFMLMILILQFSISGSEVFANASELNSDYVRLYQKSSLKNNHNHVKAGEFLATVGIQNNCNFNSIQEALNADFDVIRVAGSDIIYNENLVINNKSVTIEGGFDTCTDAAANIGNDLQAFLSGGGVDTAIRILGNNQKNTVKIKNVFIGDGKANNALSGGAITAQGTNLDLILEQSTVAGNTSSFNAGGIYISGQTNVRLMDSLIFDNQASLSGGALYCSGASAGFVIQGETLIDGNKANKGAGLYLTNFCSTDVYSPVIFKDNEATSSGGAVSVNNHAKLEIYGGRVCLGPNICFGGIDSHPVTFDGNESGAGSAIGVFGTNALANARNVLVKNHNGVAIAVNGSGAQFVTSPINDKACWFPGKCNQFINNRRVFSVSSGGVVDVNKSFISGNNGYVARVSSFVSLIDDDIQSSLNIDGSYIIDNFGYSALMITDRQLASLTVNNSTIAGNSSDSNSTRSTFKVNNGANLLVYSSIIDSQDPTEVLVDDALFDNQSVVSFYCVIAHETNSIPDGSQQFNVLTVDPSFIDPQDGNYHIKGSSLAVDLCDAGFGSQNNTDMDGDLRGWDDPSITNAEGPFDIGADETYANDVIFEDGF